MSDRSIPHVYRAHDKRAYFVPEHVEAWMRGAELEEVGLPGGGRLVRPKGMT